MRTLVAVVALCALAGCTGPETPYAEAVQAARLDSTTLRIAGQVNEWTPDARVQDYVLLRAAEETLAAGYSHFRVLERRDSSRLITTTTSESMSSYSPGAKGTKTSTYTSGSKGTNASAKGRDNNRKSVPESPYTSSYTSTTRLPGYTLVIRMYKGLEPPDVAAGVYDAAEVVRAHARETKG